MAYLKELKLTVLTDASGDGSAIATRSVMGRLYAVVWEKGTFDNGVDAVLSTINHDGADANLLTLTNANADATYYPRALVHDNAGAALTGTSGGDREMPLIVGVPKLVIAQGGNAKTGACILYYLED